MRLFLDTSSLIKLYHEENGSDTVKNVIIKNPVSSILLSELALVEFLSALWKKRRLGELNSEIVEQIALLFEKDASQFNFVPIHSDIIDNACALVNKYGLEGCAPWIAFS